MKWSEEDQRAALEWQAWQSSICSGCGYSHVDTTVDDGPEFEAEAITCFACKARDEAQQKWLEQGSNDVAGVKFVARVAGDG